MGKAQSVDFEAATRGSDGYIHITGTSNAIPIRESRLGVELIGIDERAIPPAGRIGETEDLIGSVFVKDGKVSHAHTFTGSSSTSREIEHQDQKDQEKDELMTSGCGGHL